MMLIAVIRMVASESRWLKRAAPSMAPQNSASRATASRRLRAWSALIRPALRSASMRHLLAGHGVQGEACRDLGGAHRAVADHEVLNGDQTPGKMTKPTT